ncbi:MAG TPA: hypothetical protein VMX17_15330 [Candidatus Glassbacteria bacterium]|nr:hypothetical protein [Candidatus Glassbacteria bacterium]
MKRSTVERKRAKIGNYAQRKAEQLAGQFRSTSPFKYVEGYVGMAFEAFKTHKKGVVHKRTHF